MASLAVLADTRFHLKSIFYFLYLKCILILVNDDLADLLQLLRRHGYSGLTYYGLGLFLGLYPATLDIIKENNKGDIESCLRECLAKWLRKADKVVKRGGPTVYSLVSALRELGENGVAHEIDMESKCNKRLSICLFT